MIDTHSHIDGEEFSPDLAETVARAREAGVERIFVPAINYDSCKRVLRVAAAYPGYVYPMLGLHPEEVKAGYREELTKIKGLLEEELGRGAPVVAVGEVGLDFYWSREFEKEQIEAFREQTEWSVSLGLPLMIHCRKAQNETVRILRDYEGKLAGGVFHCFTGNAREARELLGFDNFLLGIGGVLTFKNSNLPGTLAQAVPLGRVVLETDSPYMAPVPVRGTRNESSNVRYVLEKLSRVYSVPAADVDRITTDNALKCFRLE